MHTQRQVEQPLEQVPAPVARASTEPAASSSMQLRGHTCLRVLLLVAARPSRRCRPRSCAP
eukprot:1701047-Pleurochrysis_carterae.AAC.1